MASRSEKVLLNQYKNAIKDIKKNGISNENIIPLIDETNIFVWYFLIKGLSDPYTNGEYIFKLTAPSNYPDKPPTFMFLTPNGIYDIPKDKHGGKICISIGEFHPNDHHRDEKSGSYGWRKSFGMMGFANQVWGSFITFDSTTSGINIINPPPSDREKKNLAQNSISYNKTHLSDIYNKIKELEEAILKEEVSKEEISKEEVLKEEVSKEAISKDSLLKRYNLILFYIVKGY
jgi:ubiquitin-protein ligase